MAATAKKEQGGQSLNRPDCPKNLKQTLPEVAGKWKEKNAVT